ncbi:cellulase family glycosylhydrolase [Hymenobacter caeli]|uniref:mannan endo-1,4-beta-mannosidase n=1 Tax=Hymenobacter caeli TaxID=2735894 RepID=A0ABX2FQJ6_9BACT|nr:cellulase family glycosylhydrolase [Hymenobacter caeli]NRT19437.1 mannan endo-1,4-beta-mannosidase [Hymenobacter caeli]
MNKLLTLTGLAALLALTGRAAPAPAGFVRARGTQFVLDGKPYRYIGANYWYGGLLATQGPAGKARLAQELDFLKQHNVTNLRVMVGAEGLSGGYQYRVLQPLQPTEGQFDEHIMAGLDYLLAELGKRDMKAVLHFTNTWEWSGGLGQYLEWNGYTGQPLPKNPDYSWDKYRNYIAQFYTCEPCKSAEATYVRYVLARTNSLTHQKYVNDPAIMAWELLNEPRPMTAAATPAFEAWMHQTAALVKSIDHNHLLTTGSEGDIATDNDMAVYERLHADPNIDYLTIHIWPKNWGWFRDTATAKSFPSVLAHTTAFVDKHVAVATKLRKPLVVEEFGLPRDGQVFAPAAATALRDQYYAALFGMMRGDTPAGRVIAGYNFWAFGGAARPVPGQVFWKAGDAYMGDPGGEEQGLNSVFDSDKSTWAVIGQYSKTLR